MDNQSLRVHLSGEPPTLDWNRATDTTSRLVIRALMPPAIEYSFVNGRAKIGPGIFKSWDTEGYKRWVFLLRDDLVWSDGQPLVAQHFVDSLERLLDARTGAPNAFYFQVVKGAKDFNEGRGDFESVGVKTLDEHRIEYTLSEPVVYFPKILSMMSALPIRRDLLGGQEEEVGDFWVDPEKLVTLGPYRIESWVPQKSITLEVNPHYSGTIGVDRVEFLMVEDLGSAHRLFREGQIHIMVNPPLKLYRQMVDRPDFFEIKDYAVEYLGFNLKKEPYSNHEFRKALVQSIDKSDMITALQGGFEPLDSWIPLGIVGGGDRLTWRHSAQEATSLWSSLDEKIKGRDILLHVYQDEDQLRLAQNLQSQWRRNLGVDVSIEVMEWRSYLNLVNSDPPGIFRLGWLALYPDPDLFMSIYESSSHYNTSGFRSPHYDKLVQKARVESDDEKRRKLYVEAQKILVRDELAVFPLYNGARRYLVSERVKNLELNPMGFLNFHQVRLGTTD